MRAVRAAIQDSSLYIAHFFSLKSNPISAKATLLVLRTLSSLLSGAVYNGHKRVHALKFQSVALPNGLIGNLYDPIGNNNYNNVWNYLCLVVTSV